MKLWIDECLSPTLVSQAHDRGYEATCTRDRGQPGAPDDESHIEQRAAECGESPTDWMLNRVVEVDPSAEACTDAVLP